MTMPRWASRLTLTTVDLWPEQREGVWGWALKVEVSK
jgi:hypothetical protein